MPGQTSYPAVNPPKKMHTWEAHSVQLPMTQLSLAVDLTTGKALHIIGRISIGITQEKQPLADRNITVKLAPQTSVSSSPFVIDVILGKNDRVYPVQFLVPVVVETARLRVARTSSWVEVVAQLSSPCSMPSLRALIHSSTLDVINSVPVVLVVPQVNLDVLLIIDVSTASKNELNWAVITSSMMYSMCERDMREQTQAAGSEVIESGRMCTSTLRSHLFTTFMLASGLQSDQTGLFSISWPQKGGPHFLILVSALRLDGGNGSMVADAAVILLTLEAMKDTGLFGALPAAAPVLPECG